MEEKAGRERKMARGLWEWRVRGSRLSLVMVPGEMEDEFKLEDFFFFSK